MASEENKKYKFEKPEECYICLSPFLDNDKPIEPCGHWVHRECQVKTGYYCGLCRSQVVFTKEEEKLVLDKIKKDMLDQMNEDRRTAFNISRSENQNAIFLDFIRSMYYVSNSLFDI